MTLIIADELIPFFNPTSDLFDQIMGLQGKIYRQQPGRETLKFLVAGKGYFIKKHTGVGWKEIIKNFLLLRWPVLGAKNEYVALKKLAQLDVPVANIAGYGQRGRNPATQQSFIIMGEIADSISLEELCAQWQTQPPQPEFKKKLLTQVASTMRVMHQAGINHRDCYICHFLLTPASDIYLIDFHRAGCRKQVPRRWWLKDLAGLYFSSMDIGLTKEDKIYFLECYFNLPYAEIKWRYCAELATITKKALALYQKHQGKAV